MKSKFRLSTQRKKFGLTRRNFYFCILAYVCFTAPASSAGLFQKSNNSTVVDSDQYKLAEFTCFQEIYL